MKTLFAVLVALVASTVSAAPTVIDHVKAFDAMTAGAPVAVQNFTLTSGRMRITFPSASAAPVKAGDDVIGVFVHGAGTFEYSADDPAEHPVMRANLKSLGSKGTLTGNKITGKLLHVLWIGPAPELTGGAGTDVAAGLAALRANMRENRGTQSALLYAMQRLNGGRLVRAEMSGETDWVYTFDEVNTRTESLYQLFGWLFEDRSRRKERYEAIIAQSPLGRDRRAPALPPLYAMTHLDYVLTASEGRDVQVTAKETIVPNAGNQRALWFGLIERFYAGDEAKQREYRVRSVTAGGKTLPFVHREGELVVELPAAGTPGQPIELTFDLAGDILVRPSGDNYWELQGAWFPEAGHEAQAYTVHGVMKTKPPFIPFTGGATIRRVTEEGYNVLETRQELPVNFVSVVAGKYHYEEEKRGNLTIRTASYGLKNTRAIKKLTALAFDMIGYYEYFLGPFPVPELNIVEINDFGWGQAPSGLMYITSEAFQPILGEANQFFSEGINERIAHEIAHQYWGVAVRWPNDEEQWLSESFAEYSAALLLKKFQGDAIYNRLVAHWRGNAKVAANTAPIPLANRIIVPNETDFQRIHLLYSKGPLLLATLHKEVGDQAFLTFLKSYQKSFRGKFGSTKDVAGLLGVIAKKDYKPFFEQYYWGTALP